ncbi:MAG TPA: hypothetical protein GXX77_03040 [Candidatus Cloacimonetes bacterium]|nr:hypothetical protein [Candidatus Cloacimonadota bacterium]
MKHEYKEFVNEISDEEAHEMIEKMARFIASRNLAPAGILLIESLHPLHSIGSQLLFFIMPFAEIIFDSHKYQRFALMIQDGNYVKALVRRIDELDEELHDERRKEAKLKRRRRRNQIKENFKNIFRKNKS